MMRMMFFSAKAAAGDCSPAVKEEALKGCIRLSYGLMFRPTAAQRPLSNIKCYLI